MENCMYCNTGEQCSSSHMQEDSPCNAHTFDCRKLVFCALLAHGKNNKREGKTNLASCAFELTAKTSQHRCTCSAYPTPAATSSRMVTECSPFRCRAEHSTPPTCRLYGERTGNTREHLCNAHAAPTNSPLQRWAK